VLKELGYMIVVETNPRYEGARAGYSSTKRPLRVPIPRSVNPRLEQEQPRDDVEGLGRRKVPTSSQRPTRGTNVPVVYTRLSPHRGLEQPDLLKGDVLFVGRYETAFGSGTDRVSRCTNIETLNRLLQLPENSLSTGNILLTPKLLQSRQIVATDIDVHYSAVIDERNSVRMRNVNQVWSSESQHGLNRVAHMRSMVRNAVAEAKNGVDSKTAVHLYPEFDWLTVPALRNWRVDGVLYGHERDESVLCSVLPHKTAGDLLLNVCVNGPCPLRNQRIAKLPQYFNNAVSAGEYLYVCIVATAAATTWNYMMKPASRCQLHELLNAATGTAIAPPRTGVTSIDFTKQDAVYTVAAYRLGRVVDNRIVGVEGVQVLLDVEIVLLNRLALWQEIVGDSNDGDLKAMMSRLLQLPPPKIINIPPVQPPPPRPPPPRHKKK